MVSRVDSPTNLVLAVHAHLNNFKIDVASVYQKGVEAVKIRGGGAFCLIVSEHVVQDGSKIVNKTADFSVIIASFDRVDAEEVVSQHVHRVIAVIKAPTPWPVEIDERVMRADSFLNTQNGCTLTEDV